MNADIRNYLVGYNFTSAFLWLFIGIAVWFQETMLQWNLLYMLLIIQSFAFLDMLHALKKWVKTNPVQSFVQTSARIIMILLMICIDERNIKFSTIKITTTIWMIAEVVRYAYYGFNLLKKINVFQFLRYHLFIVLYPAGVLLEYIIGYQFLKTQYFKWNFITILVGLFFLSYIYFFPILYKHMLKQRKRLY
ncbi:MAG: protein tyrosine phosphatase-like domain-containing protein [Chitinophagales bacterium]|nr:protein tyrosine phosphatase-like domain-containing protein [Chitinophagales bacterium]